MDQRTFTIEEASIYSKKIVADFAVDDFWTTLPESVKQVINEAKAELDNNEGIPHQQVVDEVNILIN